MSAVVVYLDNDRPVRSAEFKKSAERVAKDLKADLRPLHTGRALVELASCYENDSIDHLVVCAHGGTSWLIHHAHGVSIRRTNKGPSQVTINDFVEAWSPKLKRRCLISLASCLCSRSPRWWIMSRFGRFLSTWGPRSYQRGGERSLLCSTQGCSVLE